MTEKQLQADIYQVLCLCGITAWYTHKIGAFRHKPIIKGISDFIGIMPDGRFLAIEVKLPGKIPRPKYRSVTKTEEDQVLFLGGVNQAGGIGFFADSVELVVNKLDLPYDIKAGRIYRR